MAARGGHLGVVKIILTLPNASLHFDANQDDCIELTDEEQMSLVKRRVGEMVEIDDEGNTALHEALLNDHRHVAEYLIERNVEAAYYINKQGKSPLYMAVESGNIECVDDILNRESESMHLLDGGKSILHYTRPLSTHMLDSSTITADTLSSFVQETFRIERTLQLTFF